MSLSSKISLGPEEWCHKRSIKTSAGPTWNFQCSAERSSHLESDYERCHTKKARENAVTISEYNVSDRDWLEERFQKMETGLCSHVQEQIAAVWQQTTYQHPCGWGRGGYRGGYRGGGGYWGGYQENYQETPNQQVGNNGIEQQGERNHENRGQPQQNNGLNVIQVK